MNPSFCGKCGNALAGANFCGGCGAGVGSDPIFGRRTTAQSNLAQKAVNELKLIGFDSLLPYKDWMADKPWNLLWVRWFLGVALFPSALARSDPGLLSKSDPGSL